jgi:DNA invertase Pin-like site-specific DNA recombinase
MATIIAGIADFERELIQERIRSGIAAAKARGKCLGRRDRTQLSLDRARGGPEQEYLAGIVKRHRAKTAQIA